MISGSANPNRDKKLFIVCSFLSIPNSSHIHYAGVDPSLSVVLVCNLGRGEDYSALARFGAPIMQSIEQLDEFTFVSRI